MDMTPTALHLSAGASHPDTAQRESTMLSLTTPSQPRTSDVVMPQGESVQKLKTTTFTCTHKASTCMFTFSDEAAEAVWSVEDTSECNITVLESGRETTSGSNVHQHVENKGESPHRLTNALYPMSNETFGPNVEPFSHFPEVVSHAIQFSVATRELKRNMIRRIQVSCTHQAT